jgi:hypothetical protein
MRRLPICLAALAAAAALAPTAGAAPRDNAGCWGMVTSQRAVAVGDIGEHASAQSEPRAGLGNLGFPGDVGAFLASIDGLEATHCP